MKKVIFVLILMFLCIPMVSAGGKFSLGGKLTDTYVHIKKGNQKYEGSMYIYKRSDGEYVYCIDPFTLINTKTTYDEYAYNHSRFNLSDDKLNKLNLIAYYGYKYNNHTDIKWYTVTQFLIWKNLGVDEIYFTDSSFRKINKYSAEINEVESLVNSHYVLPSFSNSHLEYTVNSSYELTDTNNILSNYSIKSSNIDAKINGNKLNINTKDKGNYEITFVRKSPINTGYILYASNGDQSLLLPGKVNDIEFKITIEVDSGDVTVNKFDSENQDRKYATLKGAVYGIYQSDRLIATIVTNEDGIASFNNLPFGKYYIKEISPSEGYLLDENIYEFELTKENRNVTINSYENVIRGVVTLNKFDSKDQDRTFATLKGAVYGIYQDDTLITAIETDENGIAYFNDLEYGKYYIKEISPSEGYLLDTNIYEFEINDENRNIIINSYENVIKGNIVLNKYYGEKNHYDKENGAIFEVYDIYDNLIGSYETKDGKVCIELDYGKYYVVQVKGKDDYTYVEKFEINVESNQEYVFDLYDEKEILVVNVPNTHKTDYHRLVSPLFLLSGIILVIKSKRKCLN